MTSTRPFLGSLIGRSTGSLASLACLLEATAPKAGNVHRGADFEDVGFGDFLLSAWGIAPAIDRAAIDGVGAAVRAGVEATRSLVGTNTNLGMLLLLAPLAAGADRFPELPLRSAVERVLATLTPRDATDVYAAIVAAMPGGLGDAPEHDVRQIPPDDLLEAMRAAADRDSIARQYADRFAGLFDTALPMMVDAFAAGGELQRAIVETHVRLLAAWPDSLIERKCGRATAIEASTRAARVVDAGEFGSEDWHREAAELDFWLRSDGHRRNPGTTADLVCATLLAGWLDGRLPLTPWERR